MLLKEMIVENEIFRKFRLLKESGSMDGVIPIPANLADTVIKDFIKKVVLPSKVIKADTITGLGSTRAILKKLPNAKKVAGDLDLLAVTTVDRKSAMTALTNLAKNLDMDYQIAFGNIFSVAYPYGDSKYQLDLMVAEDSPDNAVYNYMVKFRYWSDENAEQNTSFLLKGAHRSELTRTLIKAVGLSASEGGFSEFVWDETYNDVGKIVDSLIKSAGRFKDPQKKLETQQVADIVGNKLKDIARLKRVLTDEDGFLKNRYPHSLFKNLPIGYEVLTDMVFKKVEGRGGWEKILDKRLGISNAIDKMHKFEDVMDLISDLLQKKQITPRGVLFAFKEMKKNFDTGKAGMNWNDDLSKHIEKRFPFLKGRW